MEEVLRGDREASGSAGAERQALAQSKIVFLLLDDFTCASMTMTTRSNSPGNLLDAVFGSEAAVRIVRVLCTAEAPLSRVEIARRTGLSLPGVSYAVNKLHTAGAVELVGGGTRQSVQMRLRHPLATHLTLLFFAERTYAATVLERLRDALAGLSPAPHAAWLEACAGPAVSILTVVVGSHDVSQTREGLRVALPAVEAEFDVAVEARVLTEADVASADEETLMGWGEATPLFGRGQPVAAPAPVASGARTHQARDAAALLRGVWLSRELTRDPTLLKRAREWLVTRIPKASPQEGHELREWLDVLDHSSLPRIQHVLSDPGERGKRLRQSNPFVPVLTPHERERMRREASP